MTPEIITSEQILRDLDQIPFFYIIILLTTALFLTSMVRRLIPALASALPPRFNYYLLPLIPIFRLLITAIAMLMLIPTIIRPTMQNFIAVFGAVGLAIGFAFKDFASSLIAGIIAVYEQPYRVGDRVSINGIYGEVKAINLRSLKLVTPDDNAVTIPHSCIWNGSIQNANDGSREQQCTTMFFLKPDHDAGMARQILRDVALVSPYTQFSKPVKISLREYPWGTQYRIRAYPVDGRDEFAFISDLTTRGKAALTEAGFKFASVPVVADTDN
ncbi:MAG: mechanosensitive ion channel family protein [Candidatus Riflebacteria bacterium]|nr:mechanosensitive ion channel family protein [Candidatus Riflebacteria bacterium]